MYENAIYILKKLNDSGFEAYIVGGFPRNRMIGIESNDIDICTSAKPEEVASIFNNVKLNSEYGVVNLKIDTFNYEITTYRKDLYTMDGNRRYSISYVPTLKEDLLRRDFIMNTLCIDQFGRYIDIMGASVDINYKEIHTVKDASISFKEDPLRILRAIRFATTLSFSLSNDIISVLTNVVNMLSNLSFARRKGELDLIFSSKNCMIGISYLKKFNIDEVLLLDLSNVSYCSNYLGIWAQCTFDNQYPFTKVETKFVQNLRYILSNPSSIDILYEYGMGYCSIVDEIRKNNIYAELNEKIPIHSRDEICLDKGFLVSHVPSSLISSVYKDLEFSILHRQILNRKDILEKYIIEKY